MASDGAPSETPTPRDAGITSVSDFKSILKESLVEVFTENPSLLPAPTSTQEKDGKLASSSLLGVSRCHKETGWTVLVAVR